ncbi:MAG: S9 family peptidase [Planctomycetes bacterium]|nr:S9 family peptidase [Planctomycetota bacterium]
MLLLTTPGLALAGGPPPTPKEPVNETLHGQPIVDPYRWLEGDDKGDVTPRVAAWTDAQNAHTRAVLDALPGRAKVEARLRELMEVGWVGAPTAAGPWYFNRERTGAQDQPVLLVRKGLQAEPRLLIDPNALDAKGLVSLDWFAPSPDGSLLAFGLSRAGDENSTLHLLDVATGRWLADEVPNKAGSVGWLPDGRRFVYSQLRDPKDAYSRRIRLHEVGRHHREDPILVEQHDTTWGPFAYPSRDGRWLIVGYYTSTRTNDLWVVDLDRYLREGELVRTDILVGQDASAHGSVDGDTLLLQTTLDAPRGRVFAVDLTRPERARWREVVPQPERAVIQRAHLGRGVLAVQLLDDARTRIERYTPAGEALGALELPGIGTASLVASDDRTEAFVSYTSFNEPPSIYRVDLLTGERALWRRPDVPVDPSTVEVKQVWYPSKDGTRVSMFLVHKKGLEPKGDLPVLLYGYGGFRNSMTPSFSATLFPWFEAGGVYAVPNLRGGGEYGDAWHRAGTLGQKQNTFDDFIAAAEWLVANRYTRPERLAIAGGSNGGLLTGAALVQRPDLFRAAISSVPLLDMLRYHRFLMARFWVPEYGSAEDEAAFAWLKAYSPYHHVKPGVRYPAVLLTAGENDARVHPLHARKMAAALQAATASPPGERPVLLWVDREGGHGAGKPLSLRVRDVADQRVFLMWQLGMLPPP